MRVWLGRQGHSVNRKRVRRLMRTMELQAIYRRPRTSQFTGEGFTGLSEQHGVRISMDGKGRYTDPDYIGMERLRRTVKYEEVYLKV